MRFFQPHENPRRRVHPRNSYPIKEIRDYIIKDSQKNVTIEQAISMQTGGGYKADEWRQLRLGDVAKKSLIQSLIGKKSIIEAPTNCNTMEFNDFLRWLGQPVPKGTSRYFALPDAFGSGRIHGYHCEKDEHYHQKVQVGEPRCPETKKALLPLRQSLGVFTVQDWMLDVPVVAASTSSNTEHGQGGATQLIVSDGLLLYLHANINRYVEQYDDRYSVERAIRLRSPWGDKIEWITNSELGTTNTVYHCSPDGGAVISDGNTATLDGDALIWTPPKLA
ncbi:hypothetical protein [Fluoribacter gormanii]|uniref:Uncharacterized protein n=1 Tax=Fluoribacter gormanii TaxID=464 RepID=A0A377GGB9_9GAMM|nr:hypothetical protein [Fluoribacter gormanii]KTD02791.1 hypothetical protein Lgor_1668 [Fluoribacter gormanii]SIR58382.1 hypothetical protein SAMN05421777_11624 [Fluoribacter gormanii]STO23808.1 Uncharacterised protein [Fluoribacter gormanii]